MLKFKYITKYFFKFLFLNRFFSFFKLLTNIKQIIFVKIKYNNKQIDLDGELLIQKKIFLYKN